MDEQVTTDEHDYKSEETLKRIIVVKVELVSSESMQQTEEERQEDGRTIIASPMI